MTKSKSRILSIEVVTVEDQAREEVLATPTTFDLAWAEDEAGWERAKMFLNSYAGGIVEATLGERSIIGSPGEEAARFDYQIVRKQRPQGARYEVSCEDRTASTAVAADGEPPADLNARNLARFIRTGTLERSLLVR